MVEPNNVLKLGTHFLVHLNKKLGNGAFGEIFLGKHIQL